MRCAACEKTIRRGQKCLILAMAGRHRLSIEPCKEEVICCSRACGVRVLAGEVFSGDVASIPAGRDASGHARMRC